MRISIPQALGQNPDFHATRANLRTGHRRTVGNCDGHFNRNANAICPRTSSTETRRRVSVSQNTDIGNMARCAPQKGGAANTRYAQAQGKGCDHSGRYFQSSSILWLCLRLLPPSSHRDHDRGLHRNREAATDLLGDRLHRVDGGSPNTHCSRRDRLPCEFVSLLRDMQFKQRSQKRAYRDDYSEGPVV